MQASVERLGTYIDVLQIHRLDRGTPKKEIMRALNDVIEKSWVRYIGASSMAAWEFQKYVFTISASCRVYTNEYAVYNGLHTLTAGMSLLACKITTISSTGKKSAI